MGDMRLEPWKRHAEAWAEMARIMPSQVVQMIDDLFPHAKDDKQDCLISAGDGSKLLGILNLLKDVPDELITLTAADYTELVLAKSTAVWWHFSPGPDFRYPGRNDYGLAKSTDRRRRSRLHRLSHVADQEGVTNQLWRTLREARERERHLLYGITGRPGKEAVARPPPR